MAPLRIPSPPRPSICLVPALLCGLGFVALTMPKAQAQSTTCQSDADCENTDWDTLNWCDGGRCKSQARGDLACRIGEAGVCWLDSDCNAAPGRVSWCAFDWDSEWWNFWGDNGPGSCFSAPRNGNGCGAQPPCERNFDCRDNDPGTYNWCYQGSCASAAKSNPGCLESGSSCQQRSDCVDDDPSTADWCFQNKCYHAPKNGGGSCGGGSGGQNETIVAVDMGRWERQYIIADDTSQLSARRWNSRQEHQAPVVGHFRISDRANMESRAYFAFDISELAPVSGLTMRMWIASTNAFNPKGAYESDDPSETVTLFGLENTEMDDLMAAPFDKFVDHSLDVPIWRDLGDGASFGQRVYTPQDDTTDLIPSPQVPATTVCGNPELPNPCGKWVDYNLNAAAVASLNAAIARYAQDPSASQTWGFGAAMTSRDPNAPQSKWEFVHFGILGDIVPSAPPSVYPSHIAPLPQLIISR